MTRFHPKLWGSGTPPRWSIDLGATAASGRVRCGGAHGRYVSVVEARLALAGLLRERVAAGDEVLIYGKPYVDLEAAAQAAPVVVRTRPSGSG